MLSGLIDMPWWGYVLATLAMTHVTIAAVTIYLHRHQAHRALDLHPAVAHFFRFWLWLTTGTVTEEWVAVHRKHHACVESEEDPHSPKIHGIRKLLLEGAELYRIGARDPETIAKYNHGCPDDWLERNVYKPYTDRGYYLLLLIDVVLFGPIGITIWAVQMLWIPILAAGVINGVGHWWGYRNYETQDISTNIVPWGVLIGGEELHNNHHAFASSAKLSSKPWEFDVMGVHPHARIPPSRQGQEASARGGHGARQTRPGCRDGSGARLQPVPRHGRLCEARAEPGARRGNREDRIEPARIPETGAIAAHPGGIATERGGEAASGTGPRLQRRAQDRLPVKTPAPGVVAAAPCDP